MLYTYNGGLLISDGYLAASVDCCCDEVQDCRCCCETWEFTLTGVDPGLDGTYTLTVTDACVNWSTMTPASATLGYVTDPEETCGLYTLTIFETVPAATAIYTLPGDQWDCEGCNTMNKDSQTGAVTFPDTVEVCCAD
jgi:hypothetical protein